ncbi:MAG: LysM peptidoglycan-binding domain-containing protein [Sphingobacteriia bacterium]|nr:LysM peptidoglycan-binding domain-containing protein [Sphingobacteriia bacterium]NCC38854.1 LysM peptidoglycan-binding domain-containing protein [Gammaproteobacteria bacterium]
MHAAPVQIHAVLVLLMLSTVPAVLASQVELAGDAPELYEVRAGDTLWGIAGRFLRDPWRWPEVWQSSDVHGDPNLIYPGDRLRLTRTATGARIQRDTASGTGTMRTVRLSPRVRVTALDAAVPTIPIASIAPFLTQPWLADSDQIRHAPTVVGFPDERLVVGVHDNIYVRRIESADPSTFDVLRPGEALRDPETNQILGFEAVLVANARLERPGDPATLRIVRAEREVSIGDRVIPASLETPLGNFYPQAAPTGMRGRILSVMDGVTQIGQYSVVTLNRGQRDGVEPGHVFEVFRGGEQRRDLVQRGDIDWNWRHEGPLASELWLGSDHRVVGWRVDEPSPDAPFPPHVEIRRERTSFITPFERAGVLMVFRVFDRVSFALILSAQRPMQVGDLVAPPDV